MSTPNKLFAVLSLIVVASLLLAACTTPPTAAPGATVIVTVPGEKVTVVVTAPPPPTAVPEVKPKTFVVCQAQEPDTLLLGATSMLAATSVQEAIYDDLTNGRSYGYQANGIKKLPSLKDGDAKQVDVEVKAGDKVLDFATDEIVTLPVTHEITLKQADGTEVKLPADSVQVDGKAAKAVQMEATYTLVDGITWEDGTPVTTDDIVWTWSVYQMSPDVPNVKYGYERANVVKVDDKTWKWVTIPGYMSSTYMVDGVATPLPKHLYDGKMTPAEMQKDEQANRKPLSYGPFKVDEWVAGDHIKMSKNPTYWRASEGLPKVDTIVYRFVPDVNQLIAQLASGECDLGTQDAGFEGSLPLVKQFESQGLLKAQIVGGTQYEHIDFNIDPIAEYTGFAGTVKNADGTLIFQNAEIRQAIAYCIDRQAIIDKALNGAGVLQDVYVPAEHPLYAGDAQITKYPFDPAKGLELLTKNGWKDGPDGILVNEKGEKFSFIQSSTNKAVRQKITQIVQSQLLENCKIEAGIDLRPAGEFFAAGPEGPMNGRKVDTGEFTWLTGVEPACNLYMTSQIPSADNGWAGQNNTGFSDPAFDAACTATNTTDEKVKAEQHAIAQKIFSEKLPSIILYAPAKICVTRPEVTGVQMDSTENSEMWNVENFDIATK